MSIKIKVATFVFILLIFVSISVFFYVELILKSALSEVERNLLREDIKRVKAALEVEQKRLLGLTKDWAAWTDAWLFMQGKNPTFVRENITIESFENNQLSLIVYIDLQGKIKAGGVYSEKGKSMIKIKDSYIAEIFNGIKEKNFNMSYISNVGLYDFEGTPIFLAIHSVLKSNQEGPTAGLLIMGRKLSDSYLEELGHLLRIERLSINFDLNVKEEVKISENFFTTSFQLNDFFERPNVMVTFLKEKQLWSLFRPKISELTTFYLISLLLFIFVFILFTKKSVLEKIERLIRDLKEIEFGKLKRVRKLSSDEFGFLGETINSLLRTIEIQTAEVLKTKEIFEIIAQNSDAVIVLVSKEGEILYTNEKAKEILEPKKNYYEFFDKMLNSQGTQKISLSEFELSPNTFVSGLLTRVQDNSIILLAHDVTRLRLERQRLLDKVSKDTLTPLFSRTFFENSFRRLQLESGLEQPLSMVIVAIDNISEINQKFGRERGDEIIRKVGTQIKTMIRQEDLACRWKLGEFLIVSKGDRTVADSLVERIGGNLNSLTVDAQLEGHELKIKVYSFEIDKTKSLNEIVADFTE